MPRCYRLRRHTTGGDGGKGTTGGNGGSGSSASNGGNIAIGDGGSANGGAGGKGNATGGDGGSGANSSGGNVSVDQGGSATGGNGGSSASGGGDGGNGTATDSGSTTINGGATGGNGGSATEDGDGGNGGNGAADNKGDTINGSGTVTGGNGGDGAGTGVGGNGGGGLPDGVIAGSGLTENKGENGRKATVTIDDDKAGTTVTVPDKETLTDAALTDDEKKNPDITDVKIILSVEKKNDKPDKDKVEGALAGSAVDTVGAYFNIELSKTITKNGEALPSEKVTDATNEVEITITIPKDIRGYSDYSVIRVHNGQGEVLATTQSGDELTFRTRKFSTYAIAYAKSTTPPPQPPHNGGGGDDGDSSSDNGEYDFWMAVKNRVNTANKGDVVRVSAKSYDKMPVVVMNELYKDGVGMVITWNGGKDIVIPAGKALGAEKGRFYWPLSLLAEKYSGMELVKTDISNITNPGTGGGYRYFDASVGNTTPVNGNIVETAIETKEISPNTPVAVTPPTAGFEQGAFADMPDAQKANGSLAIMVIMTMLAAAACGMWLWRNKNKDAKQ